MLDMMFTRSISPAKHFDSEGDYGSAFNAQLSTPLGLALDKDHTPPGTPSSRSVCSSVCFRLSVFETFTAQCIQAFNLNSHRGGAHMKCVIVSFATCCRKRGMYFSTDVYTDSMSCQCQVL